MPVCWRSVVVLSVLVAVVTGVRLKSRSGELEGVERTTPRTGRPYYAFTSVPYAQPPLGPLRLKNPVKSNGWSGVLDATKPAPLCTQINFFIPSLRNQTVGQEDCLYLNIYTPNLDSRRKLPVLAYIHGGGFRCGTPIPGEHAPTNFMEEDVVLVTLHYRLGVLGFLSTEDEEIPGNYGLKDQAMAIKWIHDNIEAFGGDPSSITAFGESSGGASAHYQILSNLSRDFLKGAIAQSGLVNDVWSVSPPGRARRNAMRLAEILHCDFNYGFLACLQKVDARKLNTAESKFVVWDFDPGVVFQPVVEPDGDGAFMTEDPLKMDSRKPLMTGVVTSEGSIKSLAIADQDDSVLDEFIKNYDKIISAVLFLEPDTRRLAELLSGVKERYFQDLKNHYEVLMGLEKLYGDFLFYYPMYKSLRSHKGPKYGYVFDHRAEKTTFQIISGPNFSGKYINDRPGHTDELLSLFNWTSIEPYLKVSKEDSQVSIRLVKLWCNFAKYQNPAPANSQVTWDHYENGNVFHIRTYEDSMVHWPYDEAAEFWEQTFQIIKPQGRAKEEL